MVHLSKRSTLSGVETYLHNNRLKSSTLIVDIRIFKLLHIQKFHLMNDDKLTYAELKIKALEEELEKLKSDRITEADIFFQTLFTSSHSIKLIIEFETGKIINANIAACNFYGYSFDELVKMNINQINTLSDEEIKLEMLNAKTDKRNHFYFKHKLKNGEIKDVEVYSGKILFQKKEHLYSIIHDVTQQKQNEIALLEVKAKAEENKERYKRIIEGITDYLYTVKVKDGKAIETRHSEACIAVTGYTSKEFDSDPYLWINMVVPEERELVAGTFLKLLEGTDIFSIEHRIIHKNGSIRWISDTLVPKHDTNGVLISYDGIIKDITERKQAELALILRESYLSAIIENQPGLLWLKDLNSRFLAVNSKFSNSCGLDNPETVVGKTDLEIWPLDLATKYIEDDTRVINSGTPYIVEEPILDKGEIKWFETFKTPIFNKQGKVIGTTGYSHDITERTQSLEIIAKEQTLLKTLIDNLPSGVFVKDKNYRKIIANKLHLSSMAGHLSNLALDPGTDILGKTDFEIISKEWAEKYLIDDQLVIRDGQSIINKEEEGVGPDGKQIWLLVSKIPLRDKDGVINGMVGITTDVTNFKQTEILLQEKTQVIETQNEEYQQINEELLQTNDELLQAKERAEVSNRLKTAFLQNISHEIRTPMNGIMGFIELLKDPGITGEKQKEFLQIIEQSGQRLLGIINNIIDLSIIEAGQILISSKEINLNNLLHQLHAFFNPDAEGKGLMLEYNTDFSDELCTIETDEAKLSQVLINLLKNAIKFTKKGSINFGYHHKTNIIEFYVQDTGIGIPVNQREIIFERFIQGETSINREYEGAGLGLSISKAYVEKLGGKIWVESEFGVGSTFFFNIPYKFAQSVQVITPIEKISKSSLQSINILIAEDDEHSMLLIKKTLENEKANLLFANNGQEALDLVKSHPEIQIVLMDLKMPVMDGFQATELIKILKPGLPVIAQSAYAFSDDKDKARIAGCDDFISKPIKKELLLSIINKHIVKK